MHPSVRLFGIEIPPSDFIFLMVFPLWFLTILLRRREFKFHKLFIFLGFYAFAAFLSTVFSADVFHSFIRFLALLYLVSLPIMSFNFIETREDFKKVVFAWLLGTFISLIIGIFSFYLFYSEPDNWLLHYTTYHYGAVPVGNYPRLSSTFISASTFCNYLSISLLLVFIAFKLKWLNSLLFYILYMAIVFCAIFTISSGLGGVFLSLGVWIGHLFYNKHKILARLSYSTGICFGVGFIILNIFALQEYSTAPFTFKFFGLELFPSPRILIWHESFLTFISNFFTGKGLGEESCRVIFQNTNGSFSTLTDAHNVFLSVASQSGILGLAAISFLVFYILVQKNDNFVSFGLWLAIFSAFIYQGLTGSFEDTRHIWVLIGLFIASRSIFAKND